jgi:DNA-binding MarR family transcriptional regulator
VKMSSQESYLRAILATVARQTFPPASLIELVGRGEKQLKAFNLCDGSRTQSEIAKELKLDPGNFSKSLSRWIDVGVAIRIGEGRDVRPIHVYPIPDAEIRKASKS